MRIRTTLVLAATAALVTAGCSDSPAQPELELERSFAPGARTVDVIVVLNDDFRGGGHAANVNAAQGIARSLGANPTQAYGTALFGFAASVPEGRLNALDRDPRVAYWEFDQTARIPSPGAAAKPDCGSNPSHPSCGGGDDPPSSQTTPWGVTRVGGAAAPSATAWVIDSGIDLDHPDLNVDVARSANFVSRGKNSPDDGNGHGTHVAGTIGAVDNGIDVVGVAAGASVVAVRVLDNGGSGAYSWVIAGVDYVAANAANGDVANMSLGGPASDALDDAVRAAAASGVKFALAAGNSGANAANSSPARVNGNNIWTVSAIGSNDCLASWSNWGNPPVDHAAPGVSVLSTARGGGTTTMSGTSMAAPHVAGLLASGWNGTSSNGTACADPDGNPDPIAHR